MPGTGIRLSGLAKTYATPTGPVPAVRGIDISIPAGETVALLGPNGAQFGLYGIEIDARATASPPGTQVLATITDLFGPGRSAEMTYYETQAGAKVFDAGAINFAASATSAPVSTMLANLWNRLSGP